MTTLPSPADGCNAVHAEFQHHGERFTLNLLQKPFAPVHLFSVYMSAAGF